jgi:hypothetical protein
VGKIPHVEPGKKTREIAAQKASTGGKGQHAYLLVRKLGHSAEEVKVALKHLEKWLRQQARGFDIEIVEVKGTPPVVKYRDGGFIESITYGSFAKLPREASRFSEWTGTTTVTMTISRHRKPTTMAGISPRSSRRRSPEAALHVQFDVPEGRLNALQGRHQRPTQPLGREEIQHHTLRDLYFVPALGEGIGIEREIEDYFFGGGGHAGEVRVGGADVAVVENDLRLHHLLLRGVSRRLIAAAADDEFGIDVCQG